LIRYFISSRSTSDLPSGMANAFTSGHALFSSQTRGPPRRASSLATPTKSRFATRPAHHDSVSLHDSPLSTVRRSKSEVVNCRAISEKKPSVSSPPPVPPPFPSLKRQPWRSTSSTLQDPYSSSGSFVSNHTRNAWDQVFFDGANADLAVCTDDGSRIFVHSAVLVSFTHPR